MAGAKKVNTGRSFTLTQKYQNQKSIKTVKNISGIRSTNRPTIAKIGMKPKDNKGLVTKSTLNTNV